MRYLAIAGTLLSLAAGAHAASIPDPAVTGPALAANAVGTFTSPPTHVPAYGVTDAPIVGNGDISVMTAGASSALHFYVGKDDFFGVERGGIMPVGTLVLNAPALSGSSYSISENVGPATVTGSFVNGSSGLAMTSWVATSENTAVIQLTNTGSQPLALSSQLLDGFAGSAGNPATYGASGSSTWLNVSPDTVNLELGNQLYNATGTSPFTGAIADLRVYNQALSGSTLSALDASGAPTPILRWSPSNPGAAKLSGGAYINASDVHGGSVQLDGGNSSELLIGDLPLPENQFTFTAWAITTVANGNGNIVTAQIPYPLPYGAGLPYPYPRGLTMKLVNGALSANLNESGSYNASADQFVPDSTNQFAAVSSSALPVGQWVQVAATYDGNALRIFVNGAQAAATANFPTGTTGSVGWNKMALHLGDTTVKYNNAATQGVLMQSVLGASASVTSQGNLSFTIAPGGQASIVLAAVTDRNTANYFTAAQTQSQQATAASLATLKTAHDAWWNNFYTKSFVQIPDQTIQSSWYASLYLMACCSTANAPAPGLWGNFATSTLPNWEGDYTLDYNYESPFFGLLASNHPELTDNYDQPLLESMPRGIAAAQSLIGSSNTGVYYPVHLIPFPGWSDDPFFVEEIKSNALFAAVNCITRWRYTRDTTYAAKIYPYLQAVANFWDSYLVLSNNAYVDYDDAASEFTGNDTNPTMTLGYLNLFYPAMVDISTALNVDSGRRAKWNDIAARLTPLPIVPASSISQLNALGAPYNAAGVNVLRDSTSGLAFYTPQVLNYQSHQISSTGVGQGGMLAIYPGWNIGIESNAATLQAAYNTVWLTAAWYDFNADNFFYPCAALVSYDPTAILSNLDTFLSLYRYNNFLIDVGGGGIEQLSTVPGTLAAMFIQSHQTNIHIFPNWPSNQSASFGNLNAFGGFLVSSAITLGQANYVQIQSNAGQALKLANPWPGASVQCVSSINGTSTLSGAVLTCQTQVGEVLTLTSKSAVSLPAPANLGATANGNSVTLVWNAVSGAAGYNIKRASATGGPYATLATVTSGVTYTDSNLAYQTTYYYEVSAVAPGVESANSASVAVTTGTAPPIVNNSFESPAVGDGSYYNAVPGWGWLGLGGALDAIVNPGGPSSGEPWPSSTPAGMDGSNFAQIFVYSAGGGGILYQDTGVKYQAGATYTLTAAFGLQTYQTLAANPTMFLANSSLNNIATSVISTSNLTSGAFTNQSLNYTATGNEAAGSGTYGTAGDILVGFSVSASAAQSYLDIDNVQLTGIPKTFAAWQQQYFTQAQLQNPAISGASADANGDGVSNLMACALGISPFVSASGSLPAVGTSNGHLTLTFPEPKGLTNWTTTVEVSSDLVNWYSGPSYTTQTSLTSLDANRNQVTVMDNTATSAAAQRFMRLKVTLP